MASKHSVRINALKDDDDFENITISSCLIDLLIQFPKSDNDKSDYSDLPGFKKSKPNKKDRTKKPTKRSQLDVTTLATTNDKHSKGIFEENIIPILPKKDQISKPVVSKDDIVLFPAVSPIDNVISNAVANPPESQSKSAQAPRKGDIFLTPCSEGENTSKNFIIVSETMLTTDVKRLTIDIETEAHTLINPQTEINLDALPVTACTNPTPNVYNWELTPESGCFQERATNDLLPAISLKQKDEKIILDSNYFQELQISTDYFPMNFKEASKFSPERKENQPQVLEHQFHARLGVVPICLNMEEMSCTTQAAKETGVNAGCNDAIYESTKSNMKKRIQNSSNDQNTFKLSKTKVKKKNVFLNEEIIFEPSEIQEKKKIISLNEENISKLSKIQEKKKNVSLNLENILKQCLIEEKEKNVSLNTENISRPSEIQENEKNIFLNEENIFLIKNISKPSEIQDKDKKNSLHEKSFCKPSKTQEKDEAFSLIEENYFTPSEIHGKEKNCPFNEANIYKLSKAHEKSIYFTGENIFKLSETEEKEENLFFNVVNVSELEKGVENEKNFSSNDNSTSKPHTAEVKEGHIFKSSIAQEKEKYRTPNYDAFKSKKVEEKKKYRALKRDDSESREKKKHRTSPVNEIVNQITANEIPNQTTLNAKPNQITMNKIPNQITVNEVANQITAPKDFDINANVVSKLIQLLQKRKHISSLDDPLKPCKKQRLNKNISSKDDKAFRSSKDLKRDQIITLKDGDGVSKSSPLYGYESKLTPNKDTGCKSTKAFNLEEPMFQNDKTLPEGKIEHSSTNNVVPKSSHGTSHPFCAHAAGVNESSKSHDDNKHLPRNCETVFKSSGVNSKSKHSTTKDDIAMIPEIHEKIKHTITKGDKNILETFRINRNSNQNAQLDDTSTKNKKNSKERISSTNKFDIPISQKRDVNTTLVCPVRNVVSKSSQIPTKTKKYKKVENTKQRSTNDETVYKSSEAKSKHTSISKVKANGDSFERDKKTKHLSIATTISERKNRQTFTGKDFGFQMFEKPAINQLALVKDDIVQISDIKDKRNHLPTNVNEDVSETSQTYQKSKTSTTHDKCKHTSTKTQDKGKHTSTKTQDKGKYTSTKSRVRGKHTSTKTQDKGKHTSTKTQDKGKYTSTKSRVRGKHTSTKTQDKGKHTSTKTHGKGKDPEIKVKCKVDSKGCDNLQATASDRKNTYISKSSGKHDKSKDLSAKSNGVTKTFEAHRKTQETLSIDKDALRTSKAHIKVKICKDNGPMLFLSQAENILTSINKDMLYKTSETYTKSKSISKNGEAIFTSSVDHFKKKSIASSLNKKSSDSHRKSNNACSKKGDIVKISEDELISSSAPENLHKSSKTNRKKVSAKSKSIPTIEGQDESLDTYVKQKKHHSINGMHWSSEVETKDKSLPLKDTESDQSKEGHRKRKQSSFNTEDSSTEFDMLKKRKVINELCELLVEIKERNVNDAFKSLSSQTEIGSVTLNDNETLQKGNESVSFATVDISETSLACVENTFEPVETGDSSRSTSALNPADHVGLKSGDNLMSSEINLEHNTSIRDDISKPFQANKKHGTESSVCNEIDQCYLQTSLKDGTISAVANEMSDSNQIVLEDGIISIEGNESSDSNLQTVIEDGIVYTGDNEISDLNVQTVVEDGNISSEGNEISYSNLQTIIEDGIVSTGDNEMSDSNLNIVSEDGNISDYVSKTSDSHVQQAFENRTISLENVSGYNLQTVMEEGTMSPDDNYISDLNTQTFVGDETFSADGNIISQAYFQAVIGDGSIYSDDIDITQPYLHVDAGDRTGLSDDIDITQPYLHVDAGDRTGLSDDSIFISCEAYQENRQAFNDVNIIPIDCDVHKNTSLASSDILKSTSNRFNKSKTEVQMSDSAKAVVENELDSDDCQIVKFCPSSAILKKTKLVSRSRNLNTFVDPWRIFESDDHLSVYEICCDDILKPVRNSQTSNQETRDPLKQQKLKGSYNQQETEAVAALLNLGSFVPLTPNIQPLEHNARDSNEPENMKYFKRKERRYINMNVPVTKGYTPHSTSYLRVTSSSSLATPDTEGESSISSSYQGYSKLTEVVDLTNLAQTAYTKPVDEDCIITNVSLPFSNYISSPACDENSKASMEQIKPAVPLVDQSSRSAIDNRMTGVAKEGQSYSMSSMPVCLNSKSPYAHFQPFEKTSRQIRKSEEIKSSTVFSPREPPMAHGGLGNKNSKPSSHEVMVSSDEPLDLVIKMPCLNSSTGKGNWSAQANITKDRHNQVVPNVYIISAKSQSNTGLNKPAVILRQGDNQHKNDLMTTYDISNVDPDKLATIIKETKFFPARPAIQMANSMTVNQPTNHHQIQNTPSPRPAHQSQLHPTLVSENGVQAYQKNYVQTYHSTTRHLWGSDRNAVTLAPKPLSAFATAKPSLNYITQKSLSTNVISAVNSSTEASVPVKNACQTINGQIADHRTKIISDQFNMSSVSEKDYAGLLGNGTGRAAEKATDLTDSCHQPAVPSGQWQHKIQAVKSALQKRAINPDKTPVSQDTVYNAMRSQQQTSQVKASSKELVILMAIP